jgi:hypothetical protein
MAEWTYISIHLTSALDGGEWSAPRPGRLTTGERISDTRMIDYVGPRAGLDTMGKGKIPFPIPVGNTTPFF